MSIDIETKTQDDPLLVPTREMWEQMSPVTQSQTENAIIAALEQEFNLMGESTLHFDSRATATEVLRRFFKAKGKTVFVASDLHTLYPGERAFYPDLMVVYDVEIHHRRSWNVLREGKGLDFVLEILSKDTRRKDQVDKLNLYARLQIPEYFMFDPDYLKLRGYQLSGSLYREIENFKGKIYSEILGLFLQVEAEKIRFSLPEGIDIPFARELVTQLNDKLSHKDRLISEYAKLLENEKQRAEDEKQRAEEAEAEVRRLRQLLEFKSME
ncbi:MAG: Uma2 family endonuclease [SAR324 cluster bacterium]|nr:Uma2 family endonuclease [SAR324 cluster bacterium]